MASRRKSFAPAKFMAPITQIRFVALKDGRRILQYHNEGGLWETPETVPVEALPDEERDEILEVLAKSHDPNAR